MALIMDEGGLGPSPDTVTVPEQPPPVESAAPSSSGDWSAPPTPPEERPSRPPEEDLSDMAGGPPPELNPLVQAFLQGLGPFGYTLMAGMLAEGAMRQRGERGAGGGENGQDYARETGYRAPTYAQFSPYLMTNPREQHRALVWNFLGPVAKQLGMEYPDIQPEALDEFGRVNVIVPSNELGAYTWGEYTPPPHSQFPYGSIHLYQRDLESAIHEYAHEWSVSRMSRDDWYNFDKRIDDYLSRPDPQNWRLQNELQAGYASTNVHEAYSEIARLSGGNQANIPQEFQEFYPWMNRVPGVRPSSPAEPYFIPDQIPLRETWVNPAGILGGTKTPVELALQFNDLTPQQLEFLRGAGPPDDRGYWVRLLVKEAQEAYSKVPPEFIRAYGWPRWLPRPR